MELEHAVIHFLGDSITEGVGASDTAHRYTDVFARMYGAQVNNIIADLCSCHGHMYAVIKKVLEINEGLELGGVHRPMVGVTAEDMPKVEAVAARIRAAIAKFC